MSSAMQRIQSANELFNLHTRLQIIDTAVKIAKDEGIPASKVKKIQQEKNKAQKAIDTKKKQLLKLMVLASNVQPVSQKDWYFVRHVDSNQDAELLLVCVTESCIDTLSVDNRTQPPITIEYILGMLSTIESRESMNSFKTRVLQAAIIMLKEHGIVLASEPAVTTPKEPNTLVTVVDEVIVAEPPLEVLELHYKKAEERVNKQLAGLPVNPDPKTVSTSELVASYHACLRWVERVLNITDEKQIESYYRSNIETIRKAIKDVFKADDTELLWVDRDDIKYYVNADNLVFVLGREHGDETIITLYEVDFGFSKGINSMIIREQAHLLSELSKEVLKAELDRDEKVNTISSELTRTTSEINTLKARIKHLEAEERRLTSEIDSSNTLVAMKQAKFMGEHNKLFKKWKPIKGGQLHE